MSKYFYRIFTIIDLHFGAMQPCSSGLGMTLEASDFRSVRRLVAYSIYTQSDGHQFLMASNSGEEYDFLEKPGNEYFCPVTFELLKDPRQTNFCCGNHLSRATAERLEAEGKPCPICKKAPLKTTEDLFFK